MSSRAHKLVASNVIGQYTAHRCMGVYVAGTGGDGSKHSRVTLLFDLRGTRGNCAVGSSDRKSQNAILSLSGTVTSFPAATSRTLPFYLDSVTYGSSPCHYNHNFPERHIATND